MMKFYIAIIVFFSVSLQASGQESMYELFIVGNTNLFLPGTSPARGIYPILGYDKTTSPKILIGGFGAGVSVFRPIAETLTLKGQANLSKHTYWDEPLDLRGSNNEPLGTFEYASSDLAIGINATMHYFFSRRMSVGTGLGAQVFTVTLSRTPEFKNGEIAKTASFNRYYKPFLPVVPVELSFKGENLLFNIRYEHGLSNRYKSTLAGYKTDRSGLLYFEVGFKIN